MRKKYLIAVLFLCFLCIVGCTAEAGICYNSMDGIACGTPLPPSEDESTPQTQDLTEKQYTEMTGVDFRACLPDSCGTFLAVSQYSISYDNAAPLKICSTYAKDPADNSDKNVYLEIVYDHSASSLAISYDEETIRTSRIGEHEVLLVQQPAIKHGNGQKTAATYIASFEINGIEYYLEVRNGNKKDTLEHICTEILRQLSD